MTIRDIGIAIGFELDKATEAKANKAVDTLKSAASDALSNIGVKFETDVASERRVMDSVNNIKEGAERLADNSVGFSIDSASQSRAEGSIGGIKDEAKKLEKNTVGYEVDKASENKALASIKNIKAVAIKALGAIGIAFSLVKIAALSSEFGDVNDQIRDATRGLGEQHEIQQSILNAANESRQSYAGMADVITKLAGNTDVFSGVDDAANFAALMAKEFRASGKSVQATDALMKQITTSMSKGKMDAAAMATLFRESPQSLKMLANAMGVSTERLQEMVQKGEVSATTLKAAFESSADAINSRFGEVDLSVSDALRNIRNQWGLWVSEMDSTHGVSKKVAQTMVKGFNQVMRVLRRVQDGFAAISRRVGGVDKLFRLLTIAAGAFMGVIAAQKIIIFVKALKDMDKALLKTKLKMLAIVAVIIILALLIDDFINFMQGNDSLLGSMFEKFGVDGDTVRETIFGIWEAVKGLLPFLLQLAKTMGGLLIDAVKQLLPVLMGLGQAAIPIIVDVIKVLIPLIMAIVNGIIPPLIDLVNQLIPLALQIITTILPIIIDLVVKLIPLVMSIIKQILPIIITLIQKLVPVIMQIIQTILPVIISLIEKLLPIVMQIITTVLPIAIKLIGTLLTAIGPIIDAVLPLPLLMSLLEALVPVVVFVAELLGNVLGAAFEGLMPIIDALMGYFQGLINFITGVFTGDWAMAWEGVKQIFGSIMDGLVALFKFPINIIIEGINTFLGGLNKLKIPDWVPGVGGKGINIPPIPKLAKGSDSSPDTFIAGEQGPELITNAAGSKVFTALETIGIFSALRDLMSLGAAPMPETMAAAAASSSNTTITQNIEVSNTFHGDRAGQQKSAEAMDTAADDATSEMARALAFVRG